MKDDGSQKSLVEHVVQVSHSVTMFGTQSLVSSARKEGRKDTQKARNVLLPYTPPAKISSFLEASHPKIP